MRKDDNGKSRLDLIQPKFIKELGDVMATGADKYADNSWMQVQNARNRYYSALFRHLLAWRSGEKIDKESGKSHMAHIAANAMFLYHFDEEAQNEDTDSMGDTGPGGDSGSGGETSDDEELRCCIDAANQKLRLYSAAARQELRRIREHEVRVRGAILLYGTAY